MRYRRELDTELQKMYHERSEGLSVTKPERGSWALSGAQELLVVDLVSLSYK